MSKKLTSVKIEETTWDEFKINTIKYKFSFQKLADRAIYLYNTDPDFRRMIHSIKIEEEK
jgi:hypothetical protein